MSAARDDDLAGLLRDHFASEAATLDAAEDWNDLTGRIRTSGRRRVQTVAAAAAVVVLVGVGGGFVWGRSDVGTASNDTAATGRQTAESVLSLPATTSGGDADDTSAGVAELGTPAPVVASPGEATTSEPTSGEATSSQSGADKAAALNGRSVADPGRTSSSGVSLHSWSCTDGSVTIDAATSDTVGRVVVHPEAAGDPNPAGGPALSATATVDGQARPRQLVVVGVYAPVPPDFVRRFRTVRWMWPM